MENMKFNYMLLSRLQMDCNYYLGNGGRYKGNLWANDEQRQIDKMKELYNSFTQEQQPEWITMNDILDYEKQMVI